MATPDDVAWSARGAARIAAEEDATPADVDAFHKGDKSKLLVNALTVRSGHGADMEPAGGDAAPKRSAPATGPRPRRAPKKLKRNAEGQVDISSFF